MWLLHADASRGLERAGAASIPERSVLESVDVDRPHDASGVADAVHAHLAGIEERAQQARVAAAATRAEATRARGEAEEQHRARRQSLLVAACVLASMLVAGGGALWLVHDTRSQESKTSRAIASAMQDAEHLRGEGRLEDALAATTRAQAIATSAQVADVTKRGVDDLQAVLRAEQASRRAEAAQRVEDDALVSKLDALKAPRPGAEDDTEYAAAQDARYAQAFTGYGLDVESLTPEAAGARIRASAVSLRLLRALETWLSWRRHADNPRAAEWEHLAAVSDAADSDAWSVRVRRAGLAGDAASLHAASGDKEALEAEPERALTLAGALARSGKAEEALAILNPFLLYHPDHRQGRQLATDVALALGNPAEARRHALALLAIDPGQAANYETLSLIHHALEEPGEAALWANAARNVTRAERQPPDPRRPR